MSYKIEYFKLPRDTTNKRHIHEIFDRHQLSPEESDLILDYAEQQKTNRNNRLHSSLCEYLLEINTPRAVGLLKDDYFDVLVKRPASLAICHRIEDDAFSDKLANYARKNLKQNHGRAGIRLHIDHVLKALARTNDERHLVFLKDIIETHAPQLNNIYMSRWHIGISALDALTLMSNASAQSTVNKWLSYWRDHITNQIESAGIQIFGQSHRMHPLVFCQPPVLDTIFEYLPNATKQEQKQFIQTMHRSHRSRPQYNEALLTRLLTFARDCNQYYLRKIILKTLRWEDHPLLCDLATQNALERPLTYMTQLCVSILLFNKYVSRELAQHLRNELETHPYLRTKWGLQDFVPTYLDYLTMVDDPEFDKAVLRFIREHDSPYSIPNQRYPIISKIANRNEDAFQYLVEAINQGDSETEKAIEAIAQLGERGMPIIRSLLEGNHSQQISVLHALNETHASLVPLLVDLAIRQPNSQRSIKTALQRINTEDAYEALCILERGDFLTPTHPSLPFKPI